MSNAEADDESERWWERAACKYLPKGWWYPERGSSATYVLARAICESCPVAKQCLGDALRIENRTSRNFRNGMWGGLTPDQRDKLAKRRRLNQLAKERLQKWVHPQRPTN